MEVIKQDSPIPKASEPPKGNSATRFPGQEGAAQGGKQIEDKGNATTSTVQVSK